MDITAIILAIIALLEATIAVVLEIKSKRHLKNMEQKHDKEMEEIKKQNSKELIKFENDETRNDTYETKRYEAITNYLDTAAVYLSNTFSETAYADFTKSISKIYMYLPENLHKDVKELNEAIAFIFSITYEHDFDRMHNLTTKAQKLHLSFCEKVHNLGIKPIRAPQE